MPEQILLCITAIKQELNLFIIFWSVLEWLCQELLQQRSLLRLAC